MADNWTNLAKSLLDYNGVVMDHSDGRFSINLHGKVFIFSYDNYDGNTFYDVLVVYNDKPRSIGKHLPVYSEDLYKRMRQLKNEQKALEIKGELEKYLFS